MNIEYFVFSYSYDIDWPYLVTEWFYKDVSLWNDWSTTKTDIIIAQGGTISTKKKYIYSFRIIVAILYYTNFQVKLKQITQ